LNGGDSDSDMCGYLARADLNTAECPVVHVLPVLVPVLEPVPALLLLLLLLQSPRSPTRLGGGDGGRCGCGCGLSYPQLAAPSGWRLRRRSPATEPFRL